MKRNYLLFLILFLISPVVCGAANGETNWTASTVRALDPWGDLEGNSSQDIIALYFREDEDNVYFRVDLMDLSDSRDQNIYIAIDYLDGGNTVLVQGNPNAASDISWDILLSSNASGGQLVLDTAYQDHNEYLQSFVYENTIDYVEFKILKSFFSGWDGGSFSIQAIVTDTEGSAILDKTEVVSTNSDTSSKRAKLVLFFVNLLLNNNPSTISWYNGFAFTPTDRPDEYTGSKYLLDAIEKYQLPLTLEHGIYLLPGDDFLNIGNRLKGLADEGLLEILGGLYYGHFFPMQPYDVNTVALHLAKETRQNMGYIDSNVFYPYEGLLRAGDLECIKDAGYQAIFANDRYGYYTGWINNWSDADKILEMFELATKIHKINGMTFFFHPGCFYGGFASDERWGDWVFPDTAEIFQGTDNGLHLMWRRILMDLAVHQDQEKYFMIGTDILLTPWLYQDVVENNIKWIAEHPWIEVITLSNLLGRNWTPIDHGNLSLALDEPLEQYQKKEDGHYNAYFWQHYYGGLADGHSPFAAAGTEIESYYDYIPYIRDGELIPSGLKMGDDQTENTIAYITINNLRNAPDNPLTELAWRYYFGNTGERAFHGMDESTGAVLHPAAKEQANYLGHTNKIIAASHWADELKNGIQSQDPEVFRQDFDLDGEYEYAISNDKVFAIFENDGGKLEFAFAYDSVVGPIQLIAPNQQTPIPNHTGLYADGEISNWTSGVYAAFIESGYQTDLFKATTTSDSLTFTSNDGKIMKSFSISDDTIIAEYTTLTHDEIQFFLPVNISNLYTIGWAKKILEINEEHRKGWKVSDGGYAFVTTSEADIISRASFLDSPAPAEMKEKKDLSTYPEGHQFFFPMNRLGIYKEAGAFKVSLTLSAGIYEDTIDETGDDSGGGGGGGGVCFISTMIK
ncbi:MAG: hypothetical protein ACQ9MH_25700 [Nitrospinales bacterium]